MHRISRHMREEPVIDGNVSHDVNHPRAEGEQKCDEGFALIAPPLDS